MPKTRFDGGPYDLTNKRIDEVIAQTSPGAYALDKTNDSDFRVCRVGRSDRDVKAQLKSYVGSKYRYFKFGYNTSAKTAFEKECTLYHDFDPPDNTTHPDRPEGTNWACPVDGCDALD